MLAYPWFVRPRGWEHVQLVWDHWQGLNVGKLAFLSSVIEFNISCYNAEQQRAHKFLAAKAFLPIALDGLCSYFNGTRHLPSCSYNEHIEKWGKKGGICKSEL